MKQLLLRLTSVLLVSMMIFVSCEDKDSTPDPNPGSGTESPNDPDQPNDPDDQIDPFATLYPEENDEIKFDSSRYSFNRTIYVDPESGDDANNGETESTAIKSLAQLANMSIAHGDQILLKGGVLHKGRIDLFDLQPASPDSYTHVGSYGSKKARIDLKGELAGFIIRNSSNIFITDIKLSGNGGAKNDQGSRSGIEIQSNKNSEKADNITIYNVDIRDIYYYNLTDTDIPTSRPCKEWSTSGEDNYGWGVKTYSYESNKYTKGTLQNLRIEECTIRNVSHTGIKLNGSGVKNTSTNVDNQIKGKIRDLVITGCKLTKCGGPGMQFSGIINTNINNCEIWYPGTRDDKRMWGRGSGMWLVGSWNLLFDRNVMVGSEGVADCCGAHIDHSNTNVIIQRCLSRDNAGGFIEVLGGNRNCSYRYNVSINDGWRNPKKDPAQEAYWKIGNEGCLVTINGHYDADKTFGPFQTYIYNNTIVVHNKVDSRGYTNPLIFEFETSSVQGILMKNNIFWVPEQMNTTASVHYDWNKKVIKNIAHDFMIGKDYVNIEDKPYVLRDMTPSEIRELDLQVSNNLYKLYDISYPTAGNALPPVALNPRTNEYSQNSYWDNRALGGDPTFVDPNGLTAADMIPLDSRAVTGSDKVAEITILASDNSNYPEINGLFTGFALDTDINGRPITTPFIGACSPQ